ncbi:hypothetical protein GGD41_001720 [Paraburkholderia bryophila]|uniref:Uncharacterized protein n=1 Tax=Paraburkholderia bryophila TaxID=420952 RepID=A0A7Y9W5S5_9BURK|nr:hypothetical protein [Paraburkholderia bryophila]
MLCDRLVGGRAVVGTFSSDLCDFAVDLGQQRRDLRRIIVVLIRQGVRHDQATVGINGQMQLAPAPAGLRTVLLLQPVMPSAWRNRSLNAPPSDSIVSMARSEYWA